MVEREKRAPGERFATLNSILMRSKSTDGPARASWLLSETFWESEPSGGEA